MSLFVVLIKKEPLSAAEGQGPPLGPALKAKHIPVFPAFPVSNRSGPQEPSLSSTQPPQTNPYFTFWLRILRSLGVQRNPTNPNPIAWIHRSGSFRSRHLARRARRAAGSPPKVRFSLEKAGRGALPGRLTWPARRRWSAARARRSGDARSSSARRPGGTAGSGDQLWESSTTAVLEEILTLE